MKNIFLTLVAAIALVACGDDYLNDGGTHSNKTNQTVYDYLKGNATHMFDTTCLIIDKLGLKEEINNCGTFFAYSDFSIRSFLKNRTTYLQTRIDSCQKYNDSVLVNSWGDPIRYTMSKDYYTWTLDSMIACFNADSMRMYIFNEKIVNNQELLTKYSNENLVYANQTNAKIYTSAYGRMAVLTQESTNKADWDFYQDGTFVITTKPWFLFLVKVRGSGLDDPNEDWEGVSVADQKKERDASIGCRTTDIITKTGTVLHVLHSGHMPYVFSTTYDPYNTSTTN